MRNIARKEATTNIQILSDIENIFSYNFSTLIQDTLSKWSIDKNDKSTFIFMRFESNKLVPRNLYQLKEYVSNNITVPYHRYIFPQGHIITSFKKWYIDSTGDINNISFRTIPYFHYYFEPQVILRPFDPYHYEEVPTRVFDHQVLINELCYAGYTFKLLTHIFNVHPGIKMNETRNEVSIKKDGLKKFKTFKTNFQNYLKKNYPINFYRSSCPKF